MPIFALVKRLIRMGRFDLSDELLSWVREIEGYKNKAYQDSKGVWTIGYGHTKGVSRGMT